MSTRYVGENDSLDTLWELREIDAWAEGESGWTWNDSFVLKRFRSESVNLKGLFLRVLADVRGRPLSRGVFRVDDSDWNILEVQRRKEGRMPHVGDDAADAAIAETRRFASASVRDDNPGTDDGKSKKHERNARMAFKRKPLEERRFNSKEWTKVKLCDGLSYRGWCEHCGAKFETVEKSRLLCDKCHDEICEKQHVDYSRFHRRVDVDETGATAEEE